MESTTKTEQEKWLAKIERAVQSFRAASEQALERSQAETVSRDSSRSLSRSGH